GGARAIEELRAFAEALAVAALEVAKLLDQLFALGRIVELLRGVGAAFALFGVFAEEHLEAHAAFAFAAIDVLALDLERALAELPAALDDFALHRDAVQRLGGLHDRFDLHAAHAAQLVGAHAFCARQRFGLAGAFAFAREAAARCVGAVAFCE